LSWYNILMLDVETPIQVQHHHCISIEYPLRVLRHSLTAMTTRAGQTSSAFWSLLFACMAVIAQGNGLENVTATMPDNITKAGPPFPPVQDSFWKGHKFSSQWTKVSVIYHLEIEKPA
jgi:hypothetical protein